MTQVSVLVQRLRLGNAQKEGHVLCPWCLKPVKDEQDKMVSNGFVFHTRPCYHNFLHPPLILRDL